MTHRTAFDGARERSIGFALGDLVRLIRRDFLRGAKAHRLTPELWRLLYCLDRDQGCSQRQLAGMLDLTPVTLGRMIDRLEQRGLVRRVPDPADRRAMRLFLTPAAGAPIARSASIAAAAAAALSMRMPVSSSASGMLGVTMLANGSSRVRRACRAARPSCNQSRV